jgi:uncharacterized protein YdhG (YjbR/CyaY superfamily)
MVLLNRPCVPWRTPGSTTWNNSPVFPKRKCGRGMGSAAMPLKKLSAALTSLGLTFAGKQATDDGIENYISQFPADVQAVLNKVRKTTRKAAPDAKEVISYQMPAFKQHGIFVDFAAWKKHIGLYPPISGDRTLEKAVARYAGPKGNLQFPLDAPIPLDLIERIVNLRVKQDTEKAVAKKSPTSRNPRKS